MLATLLLGSYVWILYELAPGQLSLRYEQPFTSHRATFNLYRNVVLPDLLSGLLIYLCYLYFHFYGIPLFANKKKWGWFLLQIFTGIILISATLDIAAYYREEWQYTYAGFRFFPKPGYHSRQQLDIFGNLLAVMAGYLLFLVYIAIREGAIWLIERPDGKNVYRSLIINRITLFLIIYIIIPFTAAVFHLVHNGQLVIWYYSFVIPVFLLYMTNTYWLFPLKGSHPFFSVYFLSRLLVVSFLCSMLALLSPFNREPGFVLFSFWIFQLMILSPVSWLLYQQQKDRIVQLRGAQKELVKSTAHLQFLRSQINPHFLFNTLNTLYGKALQENAEGTAESVQRLGDMMRFMLYENTLDFIAMNREIDYLNNYIALQKMRIPLSPDMKIETSINAAGCHHLIAPMLLIPFVENAFKHGINLDRKSWISIRLDCTEKEIRFNVNNSLHPPGTDNLEKESGGIGNQNVMERLKLIYPGKHQVAITTNGDEYAINLIIFP